MFSRAREELIGELGAGREAPGNEQDAALPGEKSRVGTRGEIRPVREVGQPPPGLERAERGGREVDRRLGVAAPAKRIERPDHARSPYVQSLERRRRLVDVPLVRRPQRVGIEGPIDICHDPSNRLTNALFVPRLVRERLM